MSSSSMCFAPAMSLCQLFSRRCLNIQVIDLSNSLLKMVCRWQNFYTGNLDLNLGLMLSLRMEGWALLGLFLLNWNSDFCSCRSLRNQICSICFWFPVNNLSIIILSKFIPHCFPRILLLCFYVIFGIW